MPTPIAAKTGRERVAPEPAPFRHVESALRFAYRIEGSAIVKISSLFEQMRGSTVRGESRSDGPWDDHAEAAMILALVERTLAPAKFVCVRARYTVPNDPSLEQRKQMDYRILAELARKVDGDGDDKLHFADLQQAIGLGFRIGDVDDGKVPGVFHRAYEAS